MNTKSFTLIEILIVVLTISVLSSIIYVASNGARERGEFAKVLMFSEKLSSVLAENIVAQWDFNEGTGSSVSDSSLNANTGTITGATWETTKANCVSGYCLIFNGSSDFVNCGSGDSLNLSNDFTFSAWTKSSSLTNPYGGIISWGESSNGKRRSLFSWNGGSGTDNYFYFSGYSSTANLSSNTKINDGKWHYLVATISSSNFGKVYVDGVLKNSGSLALVSYVYSGATIGRSQALEYFEGHIDNVAVYDRISSVSQIQKDYYVGINKLLINNQISKEEYSERIKLAENE